MPETNAVWTFTTNPDKEFSPELKNKRKVNAPLKFRGERTYNLNGGRGWGFQKYVLVCS
jgi:hypothetical protein